MAKAPKVEKTPAAKKAEKIAQLTTVLTEKETAAKAGWTGVLTFGLMVFPVKTYKATDTDAVKMNQLHDSCHTKLNRKMWCSKCNTEVTSDHIVSGHEYEEGQFVTVYEEEKEALKVDPTEKKLEVLNFVPASQIDPIFYESTDYVAPDKGGEMPFALLRAAMIAKQVVAVAHRVKGGRDQHVVIRPIGTNGLAMSYLYYEHEVRNFEKWPTTNFNDEKSAKLIKAAGTLIDSMTDDFDCIMEGKNDSYNQNLKMLIASKIPESGVVVPVVTVTAAPTPSTDLLAALEASLSLAPKKAKRATK